ncbi:MAG: signal recognition particle protein [Chloroflexi bacterium]|nr:signal recognition particle protein [Chloroflexota bacterium]
MLETLSAKLQAIFDRLGRRGRLSESDVDSALREIRMALLEADAHFTVAKDFLERVRARAVGAEVSRALNPAQQVIKIVHEELVATLGAAGTWKLAGVKPRVVLLAGLQGSGKTTTAAKLARRWQEEGERVLLVAADIHRPAAIDQLQKLGQSIGVQVFSTPGEALSIAREGLAHAQRESDTVVIVDTAGRMQLDQPLMDELAALRAALSPAEVLLVADAMTGQEALHIAEGFHKAVGLTGLILTKLDGDARGGAAISMRAVTGVPIRWVGVGEGLEALEAFDPVRLANRILGMGDIAGLVARAEKAFLAAEVEKQTERAASGEFSLEDLVGQMRQMRKMGSLGALMESMPQAAVNAAKAPPPEELDRQMRRSEAILLSMTLEERRNPEVLNASRRRRIATGSGTAVQEVNRLLRQFREAQKVMKMMRGQGRRGLPRIFG